MNSRRFKTAAAAAVFTTVAIGGGWGAASEPTTDLVRFTGRYGAVQLEQQRLLDVVDGLTASTEPEALLLSLPRQEQLALLYVFNPSAISHVSGLEDVLGQSATDNDDCQQNPSECAEAVQSPPSGGASVSNPPPTNYQPPPHKVVVEGKNLFNKTMWSFTQTTTWSYNGTNVTDLNASSTPQVHWVFWQCESSQTTPRTLIVPASYPSRAVTVNSSGHCYYEIEVKLKGVGWGGSIQHAYPSIITYFQGTGHITGLHAG